MLSTPYIDIFPRYLPWYGTVSTTVQWDKPGSKQLDIDSNSPVRYPCKTGLRFAGPQLA